MSTRIEECRNCRPRRLLEFRWQCNRYLLVLMSVLAVTGLMILVLGQRYAVAMESGNAGPVAVLQRTRWDFGVVSAGPTLRATFPLRNAGGRRLIIFEGSHSCDCIAGARRQIVVDPGESVELETVLNTADLDSGIQMEVDYVTNDPALPSFTLTVLGDVSRD